MAHELGHLILHRFDDVHISKQRDGISELGTDREEIEANRFAAELLMPESMIRKSVTNLGGIDPFDQDLDIIEKLADQFEVSPQAMNIRLSTLGFLSFD